ncbi:MAG: hypothetical protein EAZ85_07955 [Bacteroidetes bacterium]|nr:MAG: hypothetical protein EAZ85_07955 [Bacteroidota bacterium]
MKRERIFEFYKTEHFLLQQWERGVENKTLERVLSYVKVPNTKIAVVAKPAFLAQKTKIDSKQDLIIIISSDVLVTVYWCNHSEYLLKENEVFYLE